MIDSESLSAQALLYANGEMEPEMAAGFERQLAEDQTARDALSQAVALAQTLGDIPTERPDPRYRIAARRRLFGPKPRAERGHPIFWSLGGAAAALLLVVPLYYFLGAYASDAAANGKPPSGIDAQAAQVRADISGNDRTLRACCEVPHRKSHLVKPHSLHAPIRTPGRYVVPDTMSND